MRKNEKATISVLKIVIVGIVLLFAFNIATRAANIEIKNAKIILSNNYELEVVTTKGKVSEILKENHIVVLPDEVVTPDLDTEISDNEVITISKTTEGTTTAAIELAEEDEEVSIEQVESNYTSIVEKIIVEEVAIPYETITKDVSNKSKDTTNKVIQNGEDGLKKITYKAKYQNDKEIERTKISEEVVKEPVDKIVQVQAKTTSRSANGRMAVSGSKAEYQAYAKQKCAEYGWSDSDFQCLVSLWNKESGWNVTAQNRSSGAYGIPQALPGSKMSSAGSDYLTNYKTQIDWGLRYIKSRYGNPSSAWSHSQNTGWY